MVRHAATTACATTTALAIVVLVSASLAHAQIKNDFGLYPSGAQTCLYQSAAGSGCQGNTAAQMNGCLCRNEGNFIFPAARCIAKASPNDLTAVYNQLVSNCNDSQVGSI